MDFSVITEKRNEVGISVAELCRRAGVSRHTYYELVRNSDKGRLITLEKIVKALPLSDEEKMRLLS